VSKYDASHLHQLEQQNMGRYYPRSERHGGGGGNPGRGGIPTNINISDNSHLGNTGNSPASNVNNPNINSPSQHISLSPESLSLAHLRQKSISHPMQQCQLTIYVPPHTVGAVIGRGGRTILNVQREAMRRSAGHVAPVRISVLGNSNSTSTQANTNNANNGHANQQEGVGDSNQGDSFPTSQGGQQSSSSSTWNYHEYYNSLNQKQNQQQNQPSDDNTDDSTNDDDDWTPVIIRGDPVGCFSAVRQILPLVDRDNDPTIVLEVPIHRAKHNMLVGKGGITIAALSATLDTRIMIPPNEFMSNVGGGENFWKQRQAHSDAGAGFLFGDGGGGGNHAMNSNGNNATNAQPGTLSPNIIQLEGEIDKVELCLVKMLSIVAGERWIPTGVIVEKVEVKSVSKVAPTTTVDGTTTIGTSEKGKEGGTTAESVIIKIWTPSSKLLNLGKIRKVQRKTNTVIRRKKLRLRGDFVDGTVGDLMNEKEEDMDEDAGDGNEGENDEDDGIPKDICFAGPKTATKYIITGKTEAVRSATAQFEKILGLEPGSSPIIDTTNKTNAPPTAADGGSSANSKDANAGTKSEGEYENIGVGGGPGGKKMRRKKKRGKGGGNNTPKGYKDGPPLIVVERGDV